MIDQARILELSDAGNDPAAISRALSCSLGSVYGVLRAHRPDRPRKKRERTGGLRNVILGLAWEKYEASRIAELVGCSRAYVYRILGE